MALKDYLGTYTWEDISVEGNGRWLYDYLSILSDILIYGGSYQPHLCHQTRYMD